MKKAAYFGCVRPRPYPYTEEYATMQQTTHEPFSFPSAGTASADPLTEVIRRGARELLAQAIEAEVAESAQKRFRRLNASKLIADVIAGVTFTDGVKQHAA
jgi:hypothetical protein